MPDKLIPEIRKDMKRVSAIAQRYFRMSLKEKWEELERLEGARKRLETSLRTTNRQITILEDMPDVAQKKVLQDKLAIGVLNYLREKGKISYQELLTGNSGNEAYRVVLFKTISSLSRAGLVSVDWTFDPVYAPIKITERGRNVKYPK